MVFIFSIFPPTVNHIGGVMVGMLASRAVDLEVEPRSGQTKDYKIGIMFHGLINPCIHRWNMIFTKTSKVNIMFHGLINPCIHRWNMIFTETSKVNIMR
jgi:phosphoribosylformylglycinamidine (FGAM) synthase PurS component